MVGTVGAQLPAVVLVGEDVESARRQFQLLNFGIAPAPRVRVLVQLRRALGEFDTAFIEDERARAVFAQMRVPRIEAELGGAGRRCENQERASCFFTSKCHFQTS